jgi:hypothetical protein
MILPQEEFYTDYSKNGASLVADVRSTMSRRGDFDPSPEHYANEASAFEVLTVFEALEVEGEVLV